MRLNSSAGTQRRANCHMSGSKISNLSSSGVLGNPLNEMAQDSSPKYSPGAAPISQIDAVGDLVECVDSPPLHFSPPSRPYLCGVYVRAM